jgi:replicative DNA helicase Mcm
MVEELAEALDHRERFVNLLKTFQDRKGAYKYREALSEMASQGKMSLIIDFDDLISFDAELASELKDKPNDIIPKANAAVGDAMRVENMMYASKVKNFKARFRGLDEHVPLRSLKSQHMGRLIMLQGIITRQSNVKQQLKMGVFQCPRCNEKMIREQTGTAMNMPSECENPDCGRKGFFRLIPEESTFVDFQTIYLQEKPEELPPGQIPRSIEIMLTGDLVDISRAGDRISLVGVLGTKQEYTSRGFKLSTFSTSVDANYVEISEKEAEEVAIGTEDEKAIKELSQDPNLFKKIIGSVAPSIYGYEEIKEAIAYQLAGGVAKTMPDGIKIRGDVNILLVGDPGTAKSQMLQYIARIAPRGVYTSGKGSTAAGLTATVARDKNTNEFFLEAGALVLGDKGIACIDEIDKMRAEDRSAIHEAMEQQSYHPSFEFSMADGSKHRIGEFVDSLFDRHPERRFAGVNCEILDTKGLGLQVFTTDFHNSSMAEVDRVSRHAAPSVLRRLDYSNGRSIIVTSEHPVFVFRDGEITAVPAAEVLQGDFAPGPSAIGYLNRHPLQVAVSAGRKSVCLPEEIDASLATFLGYYASEGYSFAGSSKEVGLSNTSPTLLRKMKEVIGSCFGIEPIDYSSSNRTLRISSSRVYDFMKINFPELMRKSRSKRIPAPVFGSSLGVRESFARAAFQGDGSIETDAVAYRTASRGLAEDYQDLLRTLGINSRLATDTSNESYKVYISGDSLPLFADLIGEEFKAKARQLVERGLRNNRMHDVLPNHAGVIIIRCLKRLGVPYNGYFQMHFKENYGITRQVADSYISKIWARIAEVEASLKIEGLVSLRRALNLSQAEVAQLLHVKRSVINYAELGGYDADTRSSLVIKLVDEARCSLESVKEDLYILSLLKRQQWLRVRKNEAVLNEGDLTTGYVYDVTVEPTHNFLSNGLALHNTISIAKAGIVVQLNARCSILAAANPAFGRYVLQRTIAENIQELPVTILSRFDLIFTLLDRPEEAKDRSMTEHILKLHRGIRDEKSSLIQPLLLKKYVFYARKNVSPKLSDEASEKIEEFFLGMRSKGQDADSPVPITMRQLEAVIRLSEARAKLALRDEVTKEDVEQVVRLVKSFLTQVGIDQATGKLDIDTLMVGRPKSASDKMQQVFDILLKMERENDGGPIKREQFLERAEVEGVGRNFAERTIGSWLTDGVIYEPKPGFIKKT